MQAGDEDGWDEALGYMDACGPGWHLQIARTTSDDGLANESLRSLSNCMLSDSTRSVSRLKLLFTGLLVQAYSCFVVRPHSCLRVMCALHSIGAQGWGLACGSRLIYRIVVSTAQGGWAM